MLGAIVLFFLSGNAFLASGASHTFSLEDMLDENAPAPAPATATSLQNIDGADDPLAAVLGASGSPNDDSDHSNAALSRSTSRPSFASQMRHVNWPEASNQIVSGLVTTFFQKATLMDSERSCLESKLGEFVGSIAGIVTDAVKALSPVLGKKSSKRQNSVSNAIPFLMDGAARLMNLVEATVTIGKGCLKGDGLLVLNETARHLVNFKYIENRLIVNGIDIAQALAEAVISFEHEQFGRFGEMVGISLRKVLLSTSTKGITLPEGYATDDIIAKCSEGIAAGFFAAGSRMILTDVADDNVHIDINLNHCIVKNHAMYKDIFESIWTLIAQLIVNKGQHQFGSTGSGTNPLWVQELLLALARIPMALQRCSIMDEDTQAMFEEAMKTFSSIRFNFKFPDDKIRADKATEKVAYAVDRFAKHDYYSFGKELGKLFRELLLVVLPQKYSVDMSGRLQRNLVGEGAIFKTKQEELQSRFGSPVIVVGGAAFVILISLVASKSLRVVASWRGSAGRPILDVEVGDHEDDLEVVE